MCGCRADLDRRNGAVSTVVTTTGTGHTAAVQIKPEHRTKIRPTRPNKVRPVETREKIVVGHPVPRQVSSRLCLTSGPSLTKCGKFYFGERVMLVDPSTRMVVQEID